MSNKFICHCSRSIDHPKLDALLLQHIVILFLDFCFLDNGRVQYYYGRVYEYHQHSCDRDELVATSTPAPASKAMYSLRPAILAQYHVLVS
jgi:hypothetical protein